MNTTTLPSVLNTPLVFVDVETTGASARFGRVLEVGAIRVENGEITKEFTSLIYTGQSIPAFITQLTGITNNDVQDAPQFHEIASDLTEVMDGAIFVAHNVHFDYEFLRAEFDRLGEAFKPKLLCTVRLSRKLYPNERRHNLTSVIARLGIRPNRRHRALDDAKVLWEFIQKAAQDIPADELESTVRTLIKTPSTPHEIDEQIIKTLPTGPGVYIFKGEDDTDLYIGKSINIRERVKSHFAQIHSDYKEHRISQQIKKIDVIETCGELGALLTESELIKSRVPLHNRALQRKNQVIVAKRMLDDNHYYRVLLEPATEISMNDAEQVLGIYATKGSAKRFVEEIAHNFYLCPKLTGLESGKGKCFRTQLDRCLGACGGIEPPIAYNARFDQAFTNTSVDEWPFSGVIIITETATSGKRTEEIKVFKWCVVSRTEIVGKRRNTYDGYSNNFDLDTYRILRSFLRTGEANIALA